MDRKELPLFEFDGKEGKVRPDHYVSTPKNLPERCVIAFSKSSVKAIAEKYGAAAVTNKKRLVFLSAFGAENDALATAKQLNDPAVEIWPFE